MTTCSRHKRAEAIIGGAILGALVGLYFVAALLVLCAIVWAVVNVPVARIIVGAISIFAVAGMLGAALRE